jgi:hypothetical protein
VTKSISLAGAGPIAPTVVVPGSTLKGINEKSFKILK